MAAFPSIMTFDLANAKLALDGREPDAGTGQLQCAPEEGDSGLGLSRCGARGELHRTTSAELDLLPLQASVPCCAQI